MRKMRELKVILLEWLEQANYDPNETSSCSSRSRCQCQI